MKSSENSNLQFFCEEESVTNEIQQSEEEKVQSCELCKVIPENYIALLCNHNFCLECLEPSYKEEKKRIKDQNENFNLICSICQKITELDNNSVNAIDELFSISSVSPYYQAQKFQKEIEVIQEESQETYISQDEDLVKSDFMKKSCDIFLKSGDILTKSNDQLGNTAQIQIDQFFKNQESQPKDNKKSDCINEISLIQSKINKAKEQEIHQLQLANFQSNFGASLIQDNSINRDIMQQNTINQESSIDDDIQTQNDTQNLFYDQENFYEKSTFFENDNLEVNNSYQQINSNYIMPDYIILQQMNENVFHDNQSSNYQNDSLILIQNQEDQVISNQSNLNCEFKHFNQKIKDNNLNEQITNTNQQQIIDQQQQSIIDISQQQQKSIQDGNQQQQSIIDINQQQQKSIIDGNQQQQKSIKDGNQQQQKSIIDGNQQQQSIIDINQQQQKSIKDDNQQQQLIKDVNQQEIQQQKQQIFVENKKDQQLKYNYDGNNNIQQQLKQQFDDNKKQIQQFKMTEEYKKQQQIQIFDDNQQLQQLNDNRINKNNYYNLLLSQQKINKFQSKKLFQDDLQRNQEFKQEQKVEDKLLNQKQYQDQLSQKQKKQKQRVDKQELIDKKEKLSRQQLQQLQQKLRLQQVIDDNKSKLVSVGLSREQQCSLQQDDMKIEEIQNQLKFRKILNVNDADFEYEYVRNNDTQDDIDLQQKQIDIDRKYSEFLKQKQCNNDQMTEVLQQSQNEFEIFQNDLKQQYDKLIKQASQQYELNVQYQQFQWNKINKLRKNSSLQQLNEMILPNLCEFQKPFISDFLYSFIDNHPFFEESGKQVEQNYSKNLVNQYKVQKHKSNSNNDRYQIKEKTKQMDFNQDERSLQFLNFDDIQNEFSISKGSRSANKQSTEGRRLQIKEELDKFNLSLHTVSQNELNMFLKKQEENNVFFPSQTPKYNIYKTLNTQSPQEIGDKPDLKDFKSKYRTLSKERNKIEVKSEIDSKLELKNYKNSISQYTRSSLNLPYRSNEKTVKVGSFFDKFTISQDKQFTISQDKQFTTNDIFSDHKLFGDFRNHLQKQQTQFSKRMNQLKF